MIIDEIRNELFSLRDEKYCSFQSKLIPTVPEEAFIGVRTPDLRKYAKSLSKRADISEFLNDLPHKYFDENQLHAFIISEFRDFDRCVDCVYRFLPFVDNWATCDQMSPKVFKKHHYELLPFIEKWIDSVKTYTVRFAVGMLMEHFLGESFDICYPEKICSINSDEYYVKMMIAWYFATALAKQYDSVLPFIVDHRLDAWTHNKAIQKAVESYRVPQERKDFLRSLKIKK